MSQVSPDAPKLDPDAQYVLGPDSQPQPGVPAGRVTRHCWEQSRIFPGTVRDYWVYVPAQYTPATPASLMVFQDGEGFLKPDGTYRVPIVLDNLIHRGDLPVIVGLFVNPGAYPGQPVPEYLPERPRQIEYDTLSDRYVRFLLEEIVPEVRQAWRLTDDPNRWAIGGASSGAILPDALRWLWRE